MNKLDDILFFQSEPMSGNMLADWQIKHAKEEIKSLIIELMGEMEYRETYDMSLSSWSKDDYKAFVRNNLRTEIYQKVREL
jgi:hypothetical protein